MDLLFQIQKRMILVLNSVLKLEKPTAVTPPRKRDSCKMLLCILAHEQWLRENLNKASQCFLQDADRGSLDWMYLKSKVPFKLQQTEIHKLINMVWWTVYGSHGYTFVHMPAVSYEGKKLNNGLGNRLINIHKIFEVILGETRLTRCIPFGSLFRLERFLV